MTIILIGNVKRKQKRHIFTHNIYIIRRLMHWIITLATKRTRLNSVSCLVLLIALGLTPLTAQPVFHSEVLEKIYYSLPQEVKNQISGIEPKDDSPSFFNVILNGVEVVVVCEFNQFNEIAHLGLNIQTPLSGKHEVGLVIKYLERCFLKWLNLNSNARILEDMHSELISMHVSGEIVDVGSREQIIANFDKIQTAKDLRIDIKNNLISVIWTFDLFNNIEITFPSDIFTISGKRKDEFENELYRNLKQLPVGEINKITPPTVGLTPIDQNLFLLHTSVYEDNDEITSNIYFIRNPDLTPVFSPIYPLESISNLMLNTIRSDAEISINLNIYGQLTKPINVNINDLMSFIGHGNEVFFGWEDKDQKNLKASIFIHNSFYNYTHLLLIQLNAEKFFSQKTGLTGVLYSYVPKHNLRKE